MTQNFQLVCGNCGGKFFTMIYKFYVSNNTAVPVAVYACRDCGAVTDPSTAQINPQQPSPKEEPKKPEPKKQEPKKPEPEEPLMDTEEDLDDLTEEFFDEPKFEEPKKKRGRPKKN